MAGHWLALYTFAQFREPAETPANNAFFNAEPGVWEAMERAEGFIARSGYEDEPGPDIWGEEQVFPKYLDETGDDWAPSTISLWRDLESALAAVYRGPHSDAMRATHHLFREPVDYPPYVLWWVPENHQPDWPEAIERHELLGDTGPSAEAFTFKVAFDANGRQVLVKNDAVKAIAERNKRVVALPRRVQ